MIDIADLPHELTQLNSTSSSQATIEERPTISTGSNQNTMEQMEREALNNALAKHKWKITSAANELGISRSTIYRKMEIYNIVPPNAR
jgi:transcriptional regulator of acetoin/glycerol metabolism